MSSGKTIFRTKLTDNDSTDKDGVGTIRHAEGKIYKYIQYNDGAGDIAAVAGQVAYYYTLDGYKTSVVTSDLSDATGSIGAGVLQAALTTTYYGWIQIKGPATLTIALTAGGDGARLTPTGAGDGTLDLATAYTDHICAHAGDASDYEILCDFPF